MRVLVYGSGAREHALAWKIAQSPLLEKLYLSKPNDGFSDLGEVIDADNYYELKKKAMNAGVELLIVGPEVPLAEGIADIFMPEIKVIGPNKYWTQLESSKSFAKEFMMKNGIATAKYEVITEQKMPDIPLPFAIKADGLCGGKGVCVVHTQEQAMLSIGEYLNGKYADASKTIVIEEFLEGEELSLMSLWDGKTLLPFITARDFKRLSASFDSPNTGGMAAYCPVNLSKFQQQKLQEYTEKLEAALKNEKADFRGALYSGLIWCDYEFKVLEFNMRLGDPETQPLMMHLDSDVLEVFKLCSEQRLSEVELKWKDDYSACLTIASKGYPYDYTKGVTLKNMEALTSGAKERIFFAGVKKAGSEWFNSGGRVLSICKTGVNPYNDIYKMADELDFEQKYYRGDIRID